MPLVGAPLRFGACSQLECGHVEPKVLLIAVLVAHLEPQGLCTPHNNRFARHACVIIISVLVWRRARKELPLIAAVDYIHKDVGRLPNY